MQTSTRRDYERQENLTPYPHRAPEALERRIEVPTWRERRVIVDREPECGALAAWLHVVAVLLPFLALLWWLGQQA